MRDVLDSDECVEFATFYVAYNPISYRLRRTDGGGFELLGGYEVREFINDQQVMSYIEWLPIPTLEIGEEPFRNRHE